MKDIGEKLSAYLDGELSEQDAAKVEKLLEIDADARAELDVLMEANAFATDFFNDMLDDPAPLNLYRAINSAGEAEMPSAGKAANHNTAVVNAFPAWASMAAAVALLCAGAVGGYFGGKSGLIPGAQPVAPVQVASAGWLQDIADYHMVYAAQTRHLVEVGADESDHIQSWLGNMVGSKFTIPNLSGQDLTFQGGRLLVAAGKPVAQLLYTKPDGKVVALCIIANDNAASDGFSQTTINQANMVSWRDGTAAFVIVGDQETGDLTPVAEAAATQV